MAGRRTCIVPISRLGDIQTRGFDMTVFIESIVTGGVPETPKDPPRNFPAGASPSPDWQRCLFSFFLFFNTAGVSLRSEVSKSLRVRGSTGTPCQFFPEKQRSSQVARQRFHTPRIAGSNPASATTFHEIAREEDSNPPRLGRGDTRGGTGARDHFSESAISVSASMAAFHAAEAGAAPAWSAIFLDRAWGRLVPTHGRDVHAPYGSTISRW